MQEVVIVSGARTAIGTFGGGLKTVPVVELGALVMREAVKRANLKPVASDLMVEAAPDKLKDQGQIDLEKKGYLWADDAAPILAIMRIKPKRQSFAPVIRSREPVADLTRPVHRTISRTPVDAKTVKGRYSYGIICHNRSAIHHHYQQKGSKQETERRLTEEYLIHKYTSINNSPLIYADSVAPMNADFLLPRKL